MEAAKRTQNESGKGAASFSPPPEGYRMAALAKDEVKVAAVQMVGHKIDGNNPGPGIGANLAKVLEMCGRAGAEGCDLIVFPEFALNLSGGGGLLFTIRWTREQWLNAAVRIPGPQTDAIGRFTSAHKCYVSFASYVQLPDWPGHFINASVVVGPSGDVMYVHWKAYWGYPGIGTEYATTVYDVLDEFVGRYGWDAVWPVAVTPIGNLAGYVCSEGMNPEVARAYGFNGVEILCRNFAGGGKGFWRGRLPILFRGDCAGNLCWGVYSNNGTEGTTDFERNMAGSSMVVDPCGQVVAEAKALGDEIVTATIPIAELRSEKNRFDTWGNRHLTPGTSRGGVRTDLLVALYQQHLCQFPPNLLTKYQREHGGALPPDYRATREWYFQHARWQLGYHDPGEKA